MQSTCEISVLEQELYRYLRFRMWCRCNNPRSASSLSNVDIRDASADDVLNEQLMVAQDVQQIADLASLRQRYKIIEQTTSSILDAAEESLIDVALVSETIVYEAAKKKVNNMKQHGAVLKGRIINMLRTVFLPDSEALPRLRYLVYG